MSVFWRKLRRSVSDPEQVRVRLERLFHHADIGDRFTLDYLTDEVKAERKDSVAFQLAGLTARNVVDQIVTVVSPDGGGIRDYTDISEVPEEIFDPFQRKEIEVNPVLIRIYFTKHTADVSSSRVHSPRSRALA